MQLLQIQPLMTLSRSINITYRIHKTAAQVRVVHDCTEHICLNGLNVLLVLDSDHAVHQIELQPALPDRWISKSICELFSPDA